MPGRRRSALIAVAVLVVLGSCDELRSGSTDDDTRPVRRASGVAAGPSAPATASAPYAQPTPRAAPKPSTTTPAAAAGPALDQLRALVVRGRGPLTGYDRDRFGQAWLDADRNGCDTRNDMLRRDLRELVVRPGTQGCVVTSGVLADPYTRTRIDFVRGDSYSVDIDHVVALADAWVSGAARMGIKGRAALGNDPLNLLAVDAGANRQKGASDAASWLPPNKAYRCAYVARQVAVKVKYHLSVTSPEEAAIQRVLTTCPGQPATLDATRAPTRVDQDITDPGPPTSAPVTPSTAPGAPAAPAAGGTVRYPNCDAVRAAGVAPIRRGDNGYDAHLDRDGDGVACE